MMADGALLLSQFFPNLILSFKTRSSPAVARDRSLSLGAPCHHTVAYCSWVEPGRAGPDRILKDPATLCQCWEPDVPMQADGAWREPGSGRAKRGERSELQST